MEKVAFLLCLEMTSFTLNSHKIEAKANFSFASSPKADYLGTDRLFFLLNLNIACKDF